jgi:PAS domain S-box-containing protein
VEFIELGPAGADADRGAVDAETANAATFGAAGEAIDAAAQQPADGAAPGAATLAAAAAGAATAATAAAATARAPAGAPARPPLRLRTQTLLMLGTVMMVTMALLYLVTSARLDRATRDTAAHWAGSVAATAALSTAGSLALRDHEVLENQLRDLGALPGVLRIDVLDGEGAPLLSVLQAANGRLNTVYRSNSVPLPAAGEGQRRELQLDSRPAIQSWMPVGAGGSLGSIGVSFAVDAQRVGLDQVSLDAVVATALAGLCSLLVAHLLLRRALAPLQRLAQFSRQLVEQPGARFEHRTGSHEVAELSEALNEASETLRAQLEEIRTRREGTQAILNAVPDALIALDAEGRITQLSPAAASVFGCDPASPRRPSLRALLPELDPADLEARSLGGLYMRSSGAHILRLETEARRIDGTPFPADVSLSRTESGGTVRYTVVVRDITEQRMSLAMLNLYRRALECTTNGVVISDMQLPGQPVFYVNPAFERITGYTAEEATGRACGFLQGEDRDQPELVTLNTAVREGRSISVVLRNYRKDGRLFFNELSVAPVTAADGTVQHYVGVLSDVTERERQRLAIAERSARLNAVFDLSPDGFVVFDQAQRLVYANRAFVAMTGLDLLAEEGDADLPAFDARFAGLCSLSSPCRTVAQALAEGEPATDTLYIERPERRVLARAVRRHSGELSETILYFRDVTRETEVDRMKSEFLTTAAHELRTPMVSVFGFTELLLRRPVPEPRRRDMLETIHRQASLLINMVNELLDLARIEARQGKDLQRQLCELGPLLQQAAAPFSAQSGGERLQMRLAHGAALLHVDPEKLQRVLTNVLSNAFKYSPQGGPIEISTLDGRLAHRPAVGVRIADSGIGMTPEQLRRVFERFYRADPSGNIPGTGLGMSLVKEITELHGGQVDIVSRHGEGTVVTLWWPLAGGAPVAGLRPPAGQVAD